mmetsp:Transcript_28929/g.51710  ORF Transcript_28929/g.51710 Transcript_28929/m.51710 type:complete len:279 (+) Transcript_28929:387-1223(+)
MEAVRSRGTLLKRCTAVRVNVSSKAIPLALPTATASATHCSHSAHVRGESTISPQVTRVTEPIPDSTQIVINLFHISGHMSSARLTSTPASLKASRNCCRCLCVAGTESLPKPPKSIDAILAGTLMHPGVFMKANMRQRPPATCLAPNVSRRDSTESSPFCSGTTTVSAPITPLAFSFSATSGTCHALVHTSTTSTWPASSRLSVAVKERITVSPWVVSSERPVSRSTRSVSPRATKTTSKEGTCANFPPKYPPTAPTPYTNTFIVLWKTWGVRPLLR